MKTFAQTGGVVLLALCICVSVQATAARADPHSLGWTQQIGTSGLDRSNSVAVDSNNNVASGTYAQSAEPEDLSLDEAVQLLEQVPGGSPLLFI